MRRDLIAESPAMRHVLRLATLYARSDFPVLLTGETGTGKTLLARWIHEHCLKPDGPFEQRNCAAIEEGLAASELFGHEKGAFTGASQHRAGAFRKADGGTLFLDEISRLPLPVQGTILKAIDEGEVQTVGSDETYQVKVRLIAATNQNLWKLAREGRFAEDLMQRLAVLTIEMPPLRERREDVPLLANGFLDADKETRGTWRLDEEALQVLVEYQYPGNVRELYSILEASRLLAASGRPAEEAQSPQPIPAAVVREVLAQRPGGTEHSDERPLSIVERQTELRRQEVSATLRRHGGKISATAHELGVSRQTLSKWIKELGLSARDQAGDNPVNINGKDR